MRLMLCTLALVATVGCSQEISTGGGGSDRPSIITACSQGLKSEPQPQPVHRPSPTSPTVVTVNVPRPDPTVRCDRTDARTGAATMALENR